VTTSDIAGTLDERLAAHFDDLSPAEQRVARFLAEHREEVAFISALEIAQQLGTSDATVVRTARSLGYAGLPELKRQLIDDLRSKATPALRLGRSLEEIGTHPEVALDYVLSLQAELLEEVRRNLPPASFVRALELLDAADRILCFGVGPSAPLADHFALRLVRFGRQSGTISHTGFRLADSLLRMRHGDALVLLASGRVYHEVDVTLRRAAGLGVPVVLVTDTLSVALADRVQVALVAPRGRSGMLNTVATTMVVMEALLLGLAARDRPRSLAALEELNELRAQIVGYRVDVDREPHQGTGRSPSPRHSSGS
jgi:DNA-binding MurR/RpiR family transcriptional regulator